MADWTIQPLDRRHDRTGFTSGREALDDFLRARVMQYEKRRLGKTFVATPIGGTRVIGYVTLAAGVVAIDDAAVAFYRKYGFTPLLDSPRHLFLPIETVRKVLT